MVTRLLHVTVVHTVYIVSYNFNMFYSLDEFNVCLFYDGNTTWSHINGCRQDGY